MADRFVNFTPELDAPASHAFAITPHNTNPLAVSTRGIYVGGAGDVSLTTVEGNDVTFMGCLIGTVLPVRAKIVKSTGTTATNLIGLA